MHPYDSSSVSSLDPLPVLHPAQVKILDQLDTCFLNWAQQWQADSMVFPPLLPIDLLSQLDFLRNFPQLGLFVSPIQPDLLQDYLQSQPLSELPNQHLSPSRYLLPSAACYAIYLSLRNTQLSNSRLITTLGKCFRNEPYYQGLERSPCFSLREVVCVGTEADVQAHLARSEQALLQFGQRLSLPVALKPAHDPFYEGEGTRAQMQQRFRVKQELVYADRLALASVNFHLTFFGSRCQIRLADGSDAFSGCVGMGLERWLAALWEWFDGDVEHILEQLNQCSRL